MLKKIIGLVIAMSVSTGLFAGFLPFDRSIDWSNCGLPSGLSPAAKTADVKKDFGAKGDGKTDDSMAFISAIASLQEGGTLNVPPGEYLIKEPLVIGRDKIVIKGKGKKKPVIIFSFENDPAVDGLTISGQDGSDWMKAGPGLEKGAVKFQVEDPSVFKPGDFAEIQQDNDPVIHYTRQEWNQDWAQEVIGQVFMITAVDSKTVTIDEPLHTGYDAKMEPVIRKLNAVKECDVENLKFKRLDRGEGNTLALIKAAYCAIKDVESEYVLRAHVFIAQSYRCAVTGSYFHHAHDYGGGGHGYGVEINRHASNNLIENNEFFNLRHSMMVHVGANGNVFGYNKSKQPVATGDHTPGTIICDISVHGHYPYMNLFEGNTVQKIEVSDWWGPCGQGNTFFRNVIEGEGVSVKDGSNGQNIIGNRITNALFKIVPDQSVDASTLIIHGNQVNGAIMWDEKLGRELPESLYKKQR
jgi:hypothetical protein